MWSTEQSNDIVVYIARKLHWPRETIGKLSPAQLIVTFNHLQQQESQEEYNKNYRTASLMAAIYNTIPRKRGSKVFTPKDFLPEREQGGGKSQNNLEKMASEKGIIMPKYKQQKE